MEGPVRAVLTRDEMRAADAAALETVSHDTLVDARGHRRGPGRAAHARRRLRPHGSWWWRARATTGPTAGWRPPCWPGAGRTGAGARGRRAPARSVLPPCDLVIDAAYGTGFRGSYDAPAVPAGARVLAIDIPSGVDADTGAAPGDAVRADATVTFAA